MSTLYELLGVDRGAPADEIKRAFRREIARYHPDKVQHLGKEFQDIAAVRSAELTHAYKTLTDEAARAEYDESLGNAAAPPGSPSAKPPADTASPAAHGPAPPAAAPPPPQPPVSRPHVDRAGASDLVRKA